MTRTRTRAPFGARAFGVSGIRPKLRHLRMYTTRARVYDKTMTTTAYLAHVPATDFDTDADVLDAFTFIVASHDLRHLVPTRVVSRNPRTALVAFDATRYDVSRLTHNAHVRVTRDRA